MVGTTLHTVSCTTQCIIGSDKNPDSGILLNYHDDD